MARTRHMKGEQWGSGLPAPGTRAFLALDRLARGKVERGSGCRAFPGLPMCW